MTFPIIVAQVHNAPERAGLKVDSDVIAISNFMKAQLVVPHRVVCVILVRKAGFHPTSS